MPKHTVPGGQQCAGRGVRSAWFAWRLVGAMAGGCGDVPSGEVASKRGPVAPELDSDLAPPLEDASTDRVEPGGSPSVWSSPDSQPPADSLDAIVVPPRAHLTKAEGEVARLVAKGMSNKQIATARATKERTVANQLKSIFQKLGVQSRVELVMLLV